MLWKEQFIFFKAGRDGTEKFWGDELSFREVFRWRGRQMSLLRLHDLDFFLKWEGRLSTLGRHEDVECGKAWNSCCGGCCKYSSEQRGLRVRPAAWLADPVSSYLRLCKVRNGPETCFFSWYVIVALPAIRWLTPFVMLSACPTLGNNELHIFTIHGI